MWLSSVECCSYGDQTSSFSRTCHAVDTARWSGAGVISAHMLCRVHRGCLASYSDRFLREAQHSEGDTDSERQTETAREGGRQRDRQTETAREREGDRRTDREKETESELTYKNQVLVVHFGGKFSYYQLTLILIEGLV